MPIKGPLSTTDYLKHIYEVKKNDYLKNERNLWKDLICIFHQNNDKSTNLKLKYLMLIRLKLKLKYESNTEI